MPDTNADTERLAALRAEMAEIEGRTRKVATALLSEKVKQITALVAQAETIATENRLSFSLPFGGYYGEGATFDGEAVALGQMNSGWDGSRC